MRKVTLPNKTIKYCFVRGKNPQSEALGWRLQTKQNKQKNAQGGSFLDLFALNVTTGLCQYKALSHSAHKSPNPLTKRCFVWLLLPHFSFKTKKCARWLCRTKQLSIVLWEVRTHGAKLLGEDSRRNKINDKKCARWLCRTKQLSIVLWEVRTHGAKLLGEDSRRNKINKKNAQGDSAEQNN